MTARSSAWSRSRCHCGSRSAKLDSDPAAARAALAGAGDELALALDELRELARGLHPAVLSDRGLRAAVEMLAGRAPVPVEIADIPDERLPEPVEAAAYYLIAEALTNVAKYAHASDGARPGRRERCERRRRSVGRRRRRRRPGHRIRPPRPGGPGRGAGRLAREPRSHAAPAGRTGTSRRWRSSGSAGTHRGRSDDGQAWGAFPAVRRPPRRIDASPPSAREVVAAARLGTRRRSTGSRAPVPCPSEPPPAVRRSRRTREAVPELPRLGGLIATSGARPGGPASAGELLRRLSSARSPARCVLRPRRAS